MAMKKVSPTQKRINRSRKSSRLWFAFTALIVAAELIIQSLVTTHTSGAYKSPQLNLLNLLSYYTIDSNLIVGITGLLLALRLNRSSPFFRAFRLSGLISIIITGIVYHTVLAGLSNPHGWGRTANDLEHTVVPIIAVVGWLLFGPRGLATRGTIKFALIFPTLWLMFTLIRGAITHWYPYPFINAATHGYAHVAVSCAIILVGLLATSFLAAWLDKWLIRFQSSLVVSN
jgi:hypothetical protein